MESTVNTECDNYMKQMFKACENAYKTFYHIIFLEIYKSYKIAPKGLYVKKDHCIGILQRNFVTAGTRKNYDYAIS